jgi:outer membrane immunogenic protein
MKKLYSAALVLALSAGSALAADLPAIKGPPPPPPPPPPMWTGFYAGLNAGGTWFNSNSIVTETFGFGDPFGISGSPVHSATAAASAASWLGGGNNGGFIGGGQIGYNWQFRSVFVAGVEADIQGVAASSRNTNSIGVAFDPFTATNFVTFSQVSKRLDYIGTVRGRIGWLFTPTLLAYGTGGLAYGGANLTSAQVTSELGFNTGFGGSTFSDTRVGWTVGGGLEWLFLPNWSAKAEYLYYDLGSVRTPGVLAVGTFAGAFDWGYVASTRTRFNGNIVRVGVNYHFNWGTPPVVARY